MTQESYTNIIQRWPIEIQSKRRTSLPSFVDCAKSDDTAKGPKIKMKEVPRKAPEVEAARGNTKTGIAAREV